MLVLPVILGSVLIAASLVLALGLRKIVFTEAHTEARLRDPHTPSLTYDVPEGVDPAVLEAALHGAGFTSVAEQSGATERLHVECDPAARTMVRNVIQTATTSRYGAAGLAVGPVVFEDEG